MERIQRLEEKGKYSSGEWSEEEVKRLDDALEIYGAANWKVINAIFLIERRFRDMYKLDQLFHVKTGIVILNSNRDHSQKRRMGFFWSLALLSRSHRMTRQGLTGRGWKSISFKGESL